LCDVGRKDKTVGGLEVNEAAHLDISLRLLETGTVNDLAESR
jgi:hypothetical protein